LQRYPYTLFRPTGGAAVYGDKNAQIKISDDGADLITNKYVTKDSVNGDLVFNLHVGADSHSQHLF